MSKFLLSAGILATVAGLALTATARPELLPGHRPVAPIDPAGFPEFDPALLELGQLLFYDPILSGNQNIACATCHHPSLGTGDGLALGMGEGGEGLGMDRVANADNIPHEHIPRHAPALFNAGHADFTVMFHDGRVELADGFPNGLRSPLGRDLDTGALTVLALQAMFPVTSADEMAGQEVENDIAIATRMGNIAGENGVWALLSDRLQAIPDYHTRFDAVFDLQDGQIEFAMAGEALAAFMTHEWRADDAPFDRYLRGEADLPADAMEGMQLFYGDLGCSGCHSGPFQTDHGFHATGLVQFGPGKNGAFEDHTRDEGRFRVTGDPDDLYAFRTPSLRNVTLSDPYGHTGAYPSLASFLIAHSAPRAAWDRFDPAIVPMPVLEGAEVFAPVLDADIRDAVLAQVPYEDRELTDRELRALLAFLDSLTDMAGIDGRLGIPETVPSGLPVDR